MYVKKFPDKENKHGEWNDIDLICFGDSSIHMVNGTIVMRLFNSKKPSDRKTPASDRKKGVRPQTFFRKSL
jgi:hypothetical protein